MARKRGRSFHAGAWLAFVALYLLLEGKLRPSEYVAALLAATLAWVAVRKVDAERSVRFRPKLRWFFLVAGRAIPKVPRDCALVARALWCGLFPKKRVRGVFRTIPFEPGAGTIEAAARRALIVLGVSFAPNTYVVLMDCERKHLLVHQLVPERSSVEPGDAQWPL